MRQPVTLQISLAPSDFRHCRYLLQHQLDIWSGQVDEVLLTYDTHRSKGRFSHNWEENHRLTSTYLQTIIQEFPQVRLKTIDYSLAMQNEISGSFFLESSIPAKDFRGGPFYTYFYGMYVATHNFVFHVDSDMFFGGGSQTWLQEATELMHKNEEILFCSPLPGPPRQDGELPAQPIARHYSNGNNAFAFDSMSTRLFLVNKYKLMQYKLSLLRPSLRSMVKAYIEGNPAYDLPENIITNFMGDQNLIRVDFLGNQPGMWSLHPPYRTENFYRSLPALIQKVTANDMPADQLGFYDMNDSMCDWSEARKKLKANRWWKRILIK